MHKTEEDRRSGAQLSAEKRALRAALRNELREKLEHEAGRKRVAVVGTGGVGANLVEASKESKSAKVRSLVITRNGRRRSSSHQLILGHAAEMEIAAAASAAPRGLAAFEADGGDAISSTEFKEEVRDALDEANVVVVVAGLGGETGARSGTAVAQIARDAGKYVFGLGVKPFSFESGRRAHAEGAEEEFKDLCDQYQCLDNDNLLKHPQARAAKALGIFSGHLDTVVRTFVALQDVEYMRIIEEELDRELGPELSLVGSGSPAPVKGYSHAELVSADKGEAPAGEGRLVEVEIHLEPEVARE
jgi:cell division protein FtsZ